MAFFNLAILLHIGVLLVKGSFIANALHKEISSQWHDRPILCIAVKFLKLPTNVNQGTVINFGYRGMAKMSYNRNKLVLRNEC